MSQSKKESHAEVMENQIVGIIGGWLIVMYLFPLFHHLPQAQVATVSSALFFMWSYLRSYVIRRRHNKKGTV